MQDAAMITGNGSLFERGAHLKRLTLCLLACLVVVCCAVNAQAAEGLVLRNFVLDNQQGDMTVRYSLDLEGEKSLDAVRVALLEGETLALECSAELSRHRGYWVDKGLAKGKLVNLLRADKEHDNYVLVQEGGGEVRNDSLEDLLRGAWRNMSIAMGSFSVLQRNATYSVELDVALKQYEVPAWKRWSMFFRSFEIVPGARYLMDFEY